MNPISRHPSYFVWQRMKRNTLAMTGIAIIALAILVAVLGYLVTPDSTPMANDMSLQLTTKKPGFAIQMLLIKKNQEAHSTNIFEKMFVGDESHFTMIPITNYHFEGANIIVGEYSGFENHPDIKQKYNLANVVYSLSLNDSDVYVGKDFITFKTYEGVQMKKSVVELQKIAEEKNIITKKYLLGTDRFGRDLLSRLMIGTRISLSIGFISVAISLLLGLSLGAIGGYFRGRIDHFIMWLINVVWSIPTLLLVIAITMALGKGFWQVFVAVGLTMWVDVARVVRGQMFSIREMEFVEAGKALGYRNVRIIIKHILPNIMGPIIVISAANFASAILLEAGLSFLGIGAQPPMPSWGTMIKENYGYIIVDAAYLAILPGLAIMLMVLAFNLVGNGLRDAFDAKETMVEMR